MGNASFDRRDDRPLGNYVDSVKTKTFAFIIRPEAYYSPSGLVKNIPPKTIIPPLPEKSARIRSGPL
jgi:hypothetical protein